jgi:hypothetical protein
MATTVSARGIRRIAASTLLTIGSFWLALATDPPSSQLNPQNAHIELTDATWASSNYDIRHVDNPGGGQSLLVTALSTNSSDDLSPRLVIGSSGNTWVTWWRDGATDEVLVRKKSYSSGAWAAESRISTTGENSRHPEITNDGTRTWVAFEVPGAGSTGIAVCGGLDDGQPWPGRSILATTTYGGEIDSMIHFESDALWVTWVDSASTVGWSQYNYQTQTWTSAATDSYTNDSVSAARSRIRSHVLNP